MNLSNKNLEKKVKQAGHRRISICICPKKLASTCCEVLNQNLVAHLKFCYLGPKLCHILACCLQGVLSIGLLLLLAIAGGLLQLLHLLYGFL